jgi:hypothetical protein
MTATPNTTTPANQGGDRIQVQRQGKPTPGRTTSIRSCRNSVQDVRTAIAGVGDVPTIWTTSGPSSVLQLRHGQR